MKDIDKIGLADAFIRRLKEQVLEINTLNNLNHKLAKHYNHLQKIIELAEPLDNFSDEEILSGIRHYIKNMDLK